MITGLLATPFWKTDLADFKNYHEICHKAGRTSLKASTIVKLPMKILRIVATEVKTMN
jgi:hypothetical protein